MNWNKRDTVRTVIILCGVVLFAYVLFNFDKVSSMFSWLINILMPFVIGFAIAFVVNVPMKGLEKVLFKNKDSRLYRFRRPVCLILSFLCIIAVLTFAITMIIPEMSKTITMFAEKLPSAMDDIQRKAIKLMKDQPEIVDKIKSININWDALISNVVGIVKNGGSSVLSCQQCGRRRGRCSGGTVLCVLHTGSEGDSGEAGKGCIVCGVQGRKGGPIHSDLCSCG